MGHSATELERLKAQAGYLRSITESIWRAAGIGPGMRVLDVGCGVGDTTFLTADLVGPDGHVVGLDRSVDAIGTARQRAATDGRRNVEFVEGDFGASGLPAAAFDAVVGRFVLVHQPDIVTAPRSLRPRLRAGGVFAFHELELEFRSISDPSSELVGRVFSWISGACRLAGMRMNAVSQMPRYFQEAGLGWPDTALYLLASTGPDSFGPGYVTDTLRPLAPLVERAGLATAGEIGLDTLEARLRESCANGAVSVQYVSGGARIRVGDGTGLDGRRPA